MKLPHGCSAVLDLLRYYLRVCGSVFPKQRTIAARLHLPLRAVQRAIAWLKEHGRLLVRRRGPTSALYTLVDKPVQAVENSQLAFDFGGSFGGSFGPGPITESTAEKPSCAGALARKPAAKVWLPPEFCVNAYGRREPNPLWLRAQAVLRGARDRISRAVNPIAYTRAILRAEGVA